ncbi:MAG: signal peptide peptidase SppA [Bdellovibrionia bacterium]
MGAMIGALNPADPDVTKASVLHLKLEGVIFESGDFLKKLKKYREDDQVKAIVIQINSPGGVVGPSQEIYEEVKRTRVKYKKPVVISAESLLASGAYYIAAGADKIVTNPGSLLGSIGVIMEFANLKDLYQWAKIERFSLKTGAFKDTGAEYRAMRPEEKEYMQSTLNEVWEQFKKAVSEGRNLPLEKVEPYADGRIFTGAKAVELGFADKVGTLDDAILVAAELAGLGDDPEVFEPPKERPSVLEFLGQISEESSFKRTLDDVWPLKLLGQPLFLYPGVRGLK